MPKKYIQISFFAVTVASLLVLMVLLFKPFFTIIFTAAILAVTFYPLYEELLMRLKGRKGLASFIATALLLIFIIIPVLFLSAALLKEAVGLYNSISMGSGGFVSYLDSVISRLNSSLPFNISSQIDLASYARNILNWIIGNFDSIFITIFGGLFNFLLMLISLYYLFTLGSDIKRGLVEWSPLPPEYDEEFIDTLKISMDAVFRGRILVAAVQGALLGLGFAIFGVGSPVLWGFVGALASLIPILGTTVVLVPAVIYLYLAGSVGASIGLLLWGSLIVGLIDNFISTLFLKGKIKVHPLIVLFSILGGVEVFGFIGFLVGPVIVSTFMALMKIAPFIVSYKDWKSN